MIIFIPLFSWWVPQTKAEDPTNPDGTRKHSKTECVPKWLKKINMAILPVSIGCCLASYLVTLVQVFVYVDSRPVGSMKMPKSTRKNWIVRLLLVLGIAISFGLVTGVVLPVLAYVELARVKQLEYFVILVPIQINLGVLMGTRFQRKLERRIARKMNDKVESVEQGKTVVQLEENNVVAEDEKAPLLVEV